MISSMEQKTNLPFRLRASFLDKVWSLFLLLVFITILVIACFLLDGWNLFVHVPVLLIGVYFILHVDSAFSNIECMENGVRFEKPPFFKTYFSWDDMKKVDLPILFPWWLDPNGLRARGVPVPYINTDRMRIYFKNKKTLEIIVNHYSKSDFLKFVELLKLKAPQAELVNAEKYLNKRG